MSKKTSQPYAKREGRLVFFGSRSLAAEEDKVREIVIRELNERNPEVIVTSAEAAGVCAIVIKYLRYAYNGMVLELHHANKKAYARGMYTKRSEEILKNADFVIFIHDGKSKGTLDEIEMAKKMGVPYKYYLIEMSGDYFDLPDFEFSLEDINGEETICEA